MEVTLFNPNGQPIAYIDKTRENTIYLWSGNAVAYIEGEQVYTMQGEHIGWFEDDVFYDVEGYKIGATKWACPTVTSFEPQKGDKMVTDKRFGHGVIHRKKALKNAYGHESLVAYLSKYR